jgi:hypothetical protein
MGTQSKDPPCFTMVACLQGKPMRVVFGCQRWHVGQGKSLLAASRMSPCQRWYVLSLVCVEPGTYLLCVGVADLLDVPFIGPLSNLG